MKEKLIIKILKGAPASGKSSFAEKLIKENPGKWKRINNDSIRASLDFSHFSTKNEAMVRKLRDFILEQALLGDFNVVIDNVNADPDIFKQVCKIAGKSNKDVLVEEVPFYCDLEELISRDSKRSGIAHVGETVIKRFWEKLGKESFKKYQPKTKELIGSALQSPNPAKQDPHKPRAIIVDLDGTVSLFNKPLPDGSVETLHPGAHTRNPYDAEKSDQDSLNHAIAAVIEKFHPDHEIIFCSGREEKHRTTTEIFLKRHFSHIPYRLFMRATGDQRKDSIVKEEIFRREIEENFFITFVLDDRNQVVQFWREIGLPCFQVNPGDF